MSNPSWNFQTTAGRDRLLSVVRRESDAMFRLVAEPENWHVPTACAGWEVRDMVGHLVDATESYLTGFELAREGGPPPKSVGVSGMAGASNEAASRSDPWRATSCSSGTESARRRSFTSSTRCRMPTGRAS